jgi:uncharacterized peroxidase-related enzyme
MKRFEIPTRDQVTPSNQAIFDNLNKNLGFVPNLYAYYAKNDTALADYLAFQNRKSTLKAKEREVINLVVSQINGCDYCLAAHTALGKMNGFTEEQILDIRGGQASFDTKLDALVQFTKAVTLNKGKVPEEVQSQFFAAGYDEKNLIDVIVIVGDKTISNYLNNLVETPIDFPIAPELVEA